MKWTDRQYEAITKRDKNLLVAAAAGSGKTAVLIERIKQQIMQDNVDVDRILVVTFTNAAAAEMKAKLIRALKDEIRVLTSNADNGKDDLEAGDPARAGNSQEELKGEPKEGLKEELTERPWEEPKVRPKEQPKEEPKTELTYRERMKKVRRLRDQLAMIPSANISTFHSFAMEVIRRYFQFTDIEPNFKICDEARREVLMKDAMDKVMEEGYASGEEGFRQFVRAYASDRNDGQVRDLIMAVYRTIMSIPHPLDWLKDAVDDMSKGTEDMEGRSYILNIKSQAIDTISKVTEDAIKIRNILMDVEVSNYAAKYDVMLRSILDLSEEYEEVFAEPAADVVTDDHAVSNEEGAWEHADPAKIGFDQAGELIRKIKSLFPRKALTKADKATYTEIVKDQVEPLIKRSKERIDSLRNEYFLRSLEDQCSDILATSEHGKQLRMLVEKFHEEYRLLKQDAGLLDFSDIEHYALQVLENEEACSEYREKFKYILIDEYQDSNRIQDALIQRIARKDNVFMVGDVKQSIYKFRLAEPEIFIEKYRMGKDPALPDSEKLDLNMNFRSKAPVIEAVNETFRHLIADYDDDAALHMGVKYDPVCDVPVEFHLIKADTESGDEDIDEMKGIELEAADAAAIIKRSVGEPVYDVKQQKYRPLRLNDIVVLMRSVSGSADIFAKVLEDEGIPAYTDDSDGYFDTQEIRTILDILRIIDNMRQDIPLLSVMRSPVFGFSIEELAAIRIAHREGSYYEALKAMADDSDGGLDTQDAQSAQEVQGTQCAQGSYDEHATQDACRPQNAQGAEVERGPQDPQGTQNAQRADGRKNAELAQKCAGVFASVEKWRLMSRAMDLGEFIWYLITETGYYVYAGSMPGGKQRQINLRALADKGSQAESMDVRDIFSFLRYVENLQKSKVNVGQKSVTGENDDVVRIMTIHKSKGLEFPMVIVANMGKHFNFSAESGSAAIHKDIGIGLKRIERDGHWSRKTLLQKIIKNKMRDESFEEEMRVYYVAFTRAQDRLILTGSLKEKEIEKVSDGVFEISDASSFAQIMTYISARAGDKIKGPVMMERDDIMSLQQAVRAAGAGDISNGHVQPATYFHPEDIYAEIDRRLSFKYPYEDMIGVRSKYSVTELNRMKHMQMDAAAYENEKMKNAEISMAVPDYSESAESRSAGGEGAAAKGTLVHDFFERLDFRRVIEASVSGENADAQPPAERSTAEGNSEVFVNVPGASDDHSSTAGDILDASGKMKAAISDQLAALAASGAYTEEEAKRIDPAVVLKFFETSIGRRAAGSARLYKEQPFTLKKDISGTDTLVQGIIDCFFIEDGKAVLIDYKNSYVYYDDQELAGDDDQTVVADDGQIRMSGDGHKLSVDDDRDLATGDSQMIMSGDDRTPPEVIPEKLFETSPRLRQIRDTYSEQVDLYAEAISRIKGIEVSEKYLYLIRAGKFISL